MFSDAVLDDINVNFIDSVQQRDAPVIFRVIMFSFFVKASYFSFGEIIWDECLLPKNVQTLT